MRVGGSGQFPFVKLSVEKSTARSDVTIPMVCGKEFSLRHISPPATRNDRHVGLTIREGASPIPGSSRGSAVESAVRIAPDYRMESG
jgi:hypothetical protein